jgi:hypothetical protein
MPSSKPVKMRRVVIDVASDLDLVRVEAWDTKDKHYLGNEVGAPATAFLKAIASAVTSTFPDDNPVLNVDGFTIVSPQ